MKDDYTTHSHYFTFLAKRLGECNILNLEVKEIGTEGLSFEASAGLITIKEARRPLHSVTMVWDFTIYHLDDASDMNPVFDSHQDSWVWPSDENF